MQLSVVSAPCIYSGSFFLIVRGISVRLQRTSRDIRPTMGRLFQLQNAVFTIGDRLGQIGPSGYEKTARILHGPAAAGAVSCRERMYHHSSLHKSAFIRSEQHSSDRAGRFLRPRGPGAACSDALLATAQHASTPVAAAAKYN